MASSSSERLSNALRVLEQYLGGEVTGANALSQLLHLHGEGTDRCVVDALNEKTNFIVANADINPSAADKAGRKVIAVAKYLDENAIVSKAAPKGKAAAKSGAARMSVGGKGPNARSACRALLEHCLILTGAQNRAAKDNAVRAQGCAMISDLIYCWTNHTKAQEKLLEFAVDRVPGIRERAVRGLGMVIPPSSAIEQALCARSCDSCVSVRVAAIRSLHLSPGTAPALLCRVDDVEPNVRAELFKTLAREPAGAQHFGPAAFSRLCVALSDRSLQVRTAVAAAVEAWKEHFGSLVALMCRCDSVGDEMLADAVAAAMAARFRKDGIEAAKKLLDGEVGNDPNGAEKLWTAMFARHTIALLSEEEREDLIDIPQLLQRANEALGISVLRPQTAGVLREMLHIVASLDFCDETSRRRGERLAESALIRAPLTTTAPVCSASNASLTTIDLAVLICRKCSGLGCGLQPRSNKLQTMEAQCNARGIMLVSDLCAPLQSTGDDGEEEADGQFATRLSNRLQELGDMIEGKTSARSELESEKKRAVANEDFIRAQQLKELSKKNDAELAQLEEEQVRLKAERDSILLRALCIVHSLLRWSVSELRKDPALYGTLHQILRPVVSLPALSPEVELAAIAAISAFCSRDPGTAQNHWSLFMELLRACRPENHPGGLSYKDKKHLKMRSAVVAAALADCSLIHGGDARGLDRDEVMSAAHALAAVPFFARHIAVEPLCRWLLGLGHIFFEEHLREPAVEVQWALGWMLVEAFKQSSQDCGEADFEEEQRPPRAIATPASAAQAAKARGTSWVVKPQAEVKPLPPPVKEIKEEHVKMEEDDEDEDPGEVMATASKLMQFFNLLPKLPGKHSGPILSLAVEAVAETGLWRRAVLLPTMVNGATRWKRGFSWPQLFSFAHMRLGPEMRFRLWRAALQVCVQEPALASFAEIPFALEKHMKDSPAGAADLLREAVALGADPVALKQLVDRLPPTENGMQDMGLLLNQSDARAAEREKRSLLNEAGIDCDTWVPSHIDVPDSMPPHVRMKLSKSDLKVAPTKGKRLLEAGPIMPPSLLKAVENEASVKVKPDESEATESVSVAVATPVATPAAAASAAATGPPKRRRINCKTKDID
mmetsp:Transcript_39348/g.83865  ORF Transcript_39348/g.83865 Transcript_39348/m.83865 type:complete len:1122 (-) Transcript_39348:573-3938(-)